MFVSRECCVLKGKMSLRRADHSSRGILPIVMCLSVIAKPGQREAMGRNATEKQMFLMNLLTTFHLHTSNGLLFLAVISRRGKFFARSPWCYFTFCKMFLHTRRQHGEPMSNFFFWGGGCWVERNYADIKKNIAPLV
jgi:hypothetical protein